MFSDCGKATRLPINRNTYNNSYDCDLCDSGDWLSETEVEIHKNSVHRKELNKLAKKKHCCLSCGQVQGNHKLLLEHIKSVHLFSSPMARRVERELFICEHCHDIFFNKSLLAAHIIHKHRNKVCASCPVCPRRVRPRKLYGHLSSRHHCQSVACCPICLVKRPNRTELREHMNTHLKYYQCNVCGHIMTKERDFNLHLDKYTQPDSKIPENIQYKYCFLPPKKRSKWTYNNLKSGIKGLSIWNALYICILCRELCITEDDMAVHVWCAHTEKSAPVKKSLMCVCGQVFVNNIMLKHHVFKTGCGLPKEEEELVEVHQIADDEEQCDGIEDSSSFVDTESCNSKS